MSDEAPQPSLVERTMDTVTDATRTGAEISAALANAVSRLTEALERAKQPRQSLGVLAAVTREAPLCALFVAVLLGVAIGRRHRSSLPPRGGDLSPEGRPTFRAGQRD